MGLKRKNQIDLVRDLGLRQATVSNWVNGKNYIIMDKVNLLARYFNINVTVLVG